MRKGDQQLAIPYAEFTDTKANIEAITSPIEGMIAQQTDAPYAQGRYANGAWVWGSASSGKYRQFVWVSDGAGNWEFVSSGGEPVFNLEVLE